MRFRFAAFAVGALFVFALSVHAQNARPPSGQNPESFPAQQRPPADAAEVERGRALYSVTCTSCHGADARGGQLGGPNLLRSQLVLDDRNGERILPVIQHGRPGTAMPAFKMSDDDARAIVAFLHSLQAEGQRQGAPPPGPPVELNIVVGDARAGAEFFIAKCSACHSTTGDLQGLASRIPDPRALQNAWVAGRDMSGRGGRRGGRRGGAEGTAVPTVTIMTAAGERVQGTLVAIDDFLVTVALPDGSIRSYRRDGKVPRVDVHDPLDGHRALLRTLTNTDMHNVTAFLVTLK